MQLFLNLFMKTFSVLFACCFFLISCSHTTAIKNQYVAKPVIYKSELNLDQTWDKLVDYISQNKFSIKLIDKTSGLIVFENPNTTATIENKDAGLVHPDAFVVVPSKKNGIMLDVPVTGKFYTKADFKDPALVNGEWTVRLKTEDGKVSVSTDLKKVTYNKRKNSRKIRTQDVFESTGKFEKILADKLM